MISAKHKLYLYKGMTNCVTCNIVSNKENIIDTVVFDLFDNNIPEWVLHLLPQYLVNSETIQKSKVAQYFISKSQRILCSIPSSVQHNNFAHVQCKRISSREQDIDLELVHNCLTHGREFCRISTENGDVISEVDYSSPFLNIHGERLTSDAHSLQQLEELKERIYIDNNRKTYKRNDLDCHTILNLEKSAVIENNANNKNKYNIFLTAENSIEINNNNDNNNKNIADINSYTTKNERINDNNTFIIPFYVTERDVRKIQQYYSFLQTRQSHLESVSKIKENFETSELTAEVVDEKNETCKVANLGSLYKTPPSKYLLSVMFSVFRKFKPVDVFTKRPFCEHIAERLRVESASSRRWCSIWGTSEEYKQCDIDVLDGALSVHTVDSVGNPIELIDAICTKDPFKAYCTVYPNKSIFYNVR